MTGCGQETATDGPVFSGHSPVRFRLFSGHIDQTFKHYFSITTYIARVDVFSSLIVW